MLLLRLLWRALVSTWAWTPSQTSALRHPAPPVPSNQSTFLINCIQIGRHLLERASEKICFPPRLSSVLSSPLFLTKAHYPHTMGALSKENTQTRNQTFDFVFLHPRSQENTRFRFEREPFWWIRRINCTFWRNVREGWQIYDKDSRRFSGTLCGTAAQHHDSDLWLPAIALSVVAVSSRSPLTTAPALLSQHEHGATWSKIQRSLTAAFWSSWTWLKFFFFLAHRSCSTAWK